MIRPTTTLPDDSEPFQGEYEFHKLLMEYDSERDAIVAEMVARLTRVYTCFHCGDWYWNESEVVVTRDNSTGRLLDVSCKTCDSLHLNKLTEALMFPSLLSYQHPLPARKELLQ